MPCTSRPNDACPVIRLPVQMSAPSPIQNLYQTKSPAATPSPLPFSTLPPSKSPAGHGTFATQVCSPVQPNTSPAPLIASSPVPAQALGPAQVATSVAAALNLGPVATSVGAPMVQFLPAPAANQTTAPLRVSSNAMKPIQPKQPQILPKPAGGTGQNQYTGSLNKQVTVNHRNTMAVTPSQPNPIVIGQNQATVLPNHNVTMSSQGTLLFNGISLGLAQNPILIQGGAGGLQNLQLLVRPQQPGTLTSSSQPGAQQGVNPAALLAAWQVQNQAAQQAMLAPAKGQTVVIPGTNIITSSSPQQTTLTTNQTLHTRPNVIVNQRMVNGNQGLQIQQIQTAHGPIALAIAPQQLRSLHGANITLANAPATSGGATVGSVIQGVTIPQASQSQLQGTTLQAGVVLNSHSLAQSTALTPVTVTVSQESVPMSDQPPSQPLNITKPPSVNLEELLKQAGIVPSDPVPTLQQSQAATVVTNNILTTAPVVSMTQSQPVITQIQTTSHPTVVLSSAQVPLPETSQPQLLTQLQPLSQSQQSQAPLKLSINPVGNVFLQRPLVAASISQSLTATTSSEVQSLPSMLLQRLNDVPQVSTALTEPSLIPLTVQNINLSTQAQSPAILAVSSHSASTTSVVHSSTAPTTSVSGLIQTHPTLVQSLGQNTSLCSSTPITLATTASTKAKPQQIVPQQNDSLPNHHHHHHRQATTSPQTLPVHTVTATTTATPTVISATIPTVTAIVKSEPTNLFLTNSPITSLAAGQKLQTIQLTQQNQENLQKIQAQLYILMNQKNQTQQQRQQIQQLQMNQQKILSQGKVISFQQSPNQTIQLVQHPIQQQHIVNQSPKTTLVTQSSSIQSTCLTSSSSSPSMPNSAQQTMTKQNVHLSHLLKQVPNQSSVNASVRVVSTIAQSTPVSAATATVTVPTQMKIGNQVITLTSQQRQTFQQLQQQLKTLTPEQQQIYLTQNKQAVILKLQQQQQPPAASTGHNSTATSTVFTPSSASGASTIAVAANSSLAGGLLVIQTFGKGIAQVKSLVPAIVQEQPNRGVKRPAPTPLSQTALFQKQLASDEQGALHPDCKTPFRSVSDACKRLLSYHVFDSKTPKLKDLQKADDLFETASGQLLEKAHNVYGKYRYLLYKESMREFPTAELVMLEKLFIEDEKEALKNDKKAVEEGKVLDLPPLPDHWLHKTVCTDSSTCTTPPVTLVSTATTQASSRVTTTTTTVHVAPLISSTPIVSDKKDDVHPSKTAATFFSNTTVGDKVPSCKDPSAPSQMQKPKEEKDAEKPSCDLSKVKVEVKVEDDKNYDEWAEIQKELEMYPLESDHADNLELTTPQVDFEPPESSATLADFEPPIMKNCASNSSSSVNTYLGSMADDAAGTLRSGAQTISGSGSGNVERMDTSADWNMYNSGGGGSEERDTDANPLMNESQAAVESILQPEESQLDLSDIEEFNRHYTSEHGAVESTNPSIRCNGVKDEKNLLMPCALLMEGVDGEDIAIEQSLKSPDDDLNAQVESAINSILNLQRTDEAFDYETTETYPLDDMEPKDEEQMNLDYVGPPLELDACEVVDAALEEAVKSILM